MPDRKTYIMDTETLGRFDSSIILSIAVLKVPDDPGFDPFEAYGGFDGKDPATFIPQENWIYLKLERSEQKELGRTVCPETMEWWKGQKDREALEVLSNKGVLPCHEAWKSITKFLRSTGFTKDDVVFSRRLFESKLWEHFCKTLSGKYKDVFNPISYWQFLDPASICFLLGEDANNGITIADFPKFHKHHALYDVFLDMLRLHLLAGPED
jgi:hypothetical protein